MRGHQFDELDAAVDFVTRVETDKSSGPTVVKSKGRRTVPQARRTATTDKSEEAPTATAGWSEMLHQILGPSPTAVRELRRALEIVEYDDDGAFEDDDIYEV